MKNYVIRNLNVNDVEKIINLEITYLGETIGSDMLISENTNPTIMFLVIEENIHDPFGYIGCYHIDNECEILNFVIDEKYQHQGYGTILLNELLNKTKAKHVTLEVRSSNQKAINFYSKNDFKEISKRKSYYANGEDAIVMEKVIK